jgi:Family of unknown function (DUF6495)
MKYRILTNEELQLLEQDFVSFLIVNGVEGDLWSKINQEEPNKAIELVELFSDTVLQRVYEKIYYLENRSVDSCMVFHVGTTDMELMVISKKAKAKIDLSTPELIHDALVQNITQLDFFTSRKPLSKTREEEVHDLITSGCVLSDKAFWKSLKEVFVKQ